MARVFVTRPIPGRAFKKLEEAHEVEVYPGPGKIPREKLLEEVKGVEAILSILTEKIDGEVMDAAGKQLKIVSNYAVGFDNVDLEAAKERNVMVANTPSSLGDAVAEFTVTLAMALSRNILPADHFVREGKYKVWDPSIFLGLDLTGKTLGVVGAGTIGSVVGKRMQAVFEMRVIYHSRSRNEAFERATNGRKVSLTELLQLADVVTLHVPLSAETRHMISWDEFSLMKKTAILINTSRGPVVREKALVEAVKNKKIWGAALDVFEQEVEKERKHLDPRDWRMLNRFDNVILTPHIASATVEAREEMTQMAVENIILALSGKTPRYLVKTS
ncbi:MAG: D-glycerate dehydrogenase [Candidatus Chisholmbacteria bacterium]|nr:D-glycerate dehydrogenase [Candidatus Chisholmbacteria bacterium]